MAIAKITEISATSEISFDDAVKQGVSRANKTLKDVRGAWISEMKVDVSDGQITTYRVNLRVTFVLED